MKNRISKIVLIVSIAISSVVSVGFVDSYFEVSKNLDIFATLFRELNIYYVDDSDPGKLMKTGIDAMLKSLDPYTNYIPESNIEDYKMMTTGQYGGIGALIQKQGDYVIISEPYEGFGAFKAGLIAGDKILEVDGKSVKGKSTTDIREFLLGQPGSTIELKIERPGTPEPLLKKVTREEVKIKDVPYFGMVADSVGYIKLTGFTETASAEVKEAFNKLKEENMQSLVLDLRGNGGGLLKEAVSIVNFFVPKGADIVNTKGKIKDWDKSYVATLNPLDMDIPVVVLIDGGSASASEIVSGSLQDNDRAIVMGTQSFGKGLVQSVRPLSYNSKLKVTVAKYYTPSGRCIQKLDYSHRDDEGKVNEIADSLITEFKTVHNKRPVFDGKGISPDIEVDREPISDISVSLLTKSLFFNFATEYRLKHETIAPAKEFELSAEDYKSFVEFLSDKDYAYTTESEDLLASLEKTTKEEKYFEDVKIEYEQLKEKLSLHKGDDLNTFKEEISKILETEIVGRYYYQKGQIEISLKKDATLNEAIKTLGDKDLYNSILAGTNK
ncbi:PDZ domain-containing protein [Vicingus serpentipes]|uniref:PDZ domain-containing protein n=1 Tax=Vicingus serpentipes TaxID=1926625 RepID=A0A5C6RS78_9FLAO|nr:S41 family peptidase [Vicingus serpentipes]TXB64804.1 PDZ domain-containing protein [Vicingus serpentipes]